LAQGSYVGNLDVLQKLWNWVKEKLMRKERSNKFLLVTDNEGRTIWHMAANEGTLEIFLKLWVWAIERQ